MATPTNPTYVLPPGTFGVGVGRAPAPPPASGSGGAGSPAATAPVLVPGTFASAPLVEGGPVPIPIPLPPIIPGAPGSGNYGLTGPLFGPLESIFQGKPREQATREIARTLAASDNPVLHQLGLEYAADVNRVGAVLSSASDVENRFGPQLRAAESGLRAEGFTAADTSYLTRLIYGSGGHLTEGQLRGFNPAPNTVPPVGVPPTPPTPPPGPPPIISPLPIAPSLQPTLSRSGNLTPEQIDQLSRQSFLTNEQAGEIVGELTGQPFGGLVGREVGRAVDTADSFFNQISMVARQVASTPRGMPTTARPIAAIPVGQPAPMIDMTSDCPSCGGPRRQEGQLQHDIETEEQQYVDQRTQQRDLEIQKLEQLEKIPASQRNIPQEIARKQQLLTEAQQDEMQLPRAQGQGGFPQSVSPVPILQPQSAGAPQSSSSTLAHDDHQPSAEPSDQPVRLCLMCSSSTEAFKYLNGQAASCVLEE